MRPMQHDISGFTQLCVGLLIVPNAVTSQAQLYIFLYFNFSAT